MKNSKNNNLEASHDTFKKFNLLIIGSKMAKASSILLALFSFIFIFYSNSMLVIISLLIGIAVLVVYVFKFLHLKNIEQLSYTPNTLISSVSKFKAYLKKRKKFEIIYISIWALSLIPFLSSYLKSDLKAVIAIILFITVTAVLGMLAFTKANKEIQILENQILRK